MKKGWLYDKYSPIKNISVLALEISNITTQKYSKITFGKQLFKFGERKTKGILHRFQDPGTTKILYQQIPFKQKTDKNTQTVCVWCLQWSTKVYTRSKGYEWGMLNSSKESHSLLCLFASNISYPYAQIGISPQHLCQNRLTSQLTSSISNMEPYYMLWKTEQNG